MTESSGQNKSGPFELTANIVNLLWGLLFVVGTVRGLFVDTDDGEWSLIGYSTVIVLWNLIYFGVKGRGLRIFTIIFNGAAILLGLWILTDVSEPNVRNEWLAVTGISLLTFLSLTWPRTRQSTHSPVA